jgi:hypothetical protein
MLELSIKRRFESNHCLNRFRRIWVTFMRRRGMDPETRELLQE